MNQTEIKRKQILILVFFPVVIGLMWLLDLMEGNGGGYFIINLQICMFPIGCFMIFFPQVVEKLIRSRMSKGQYKNANKVWKGALIYGVLIGLISAGVLFALSELLAERVLGIPNSLLGLRFLIPAVCFVSFTFVIKGYFQGMGSGLPTVIADIVFYLSTGFFAYWIIMGLKDYGAKVSNLLHNIDFNAMYINAGVSVGMTIGSVIAFALMLILFLFADRSNKKHMRDGMRMTEDLPYVFRLLGLSMLPYMLVGICVNLPALTDIILLRTSRGGDLLFVADYAALYTDKLFYIVLCVLPILPGVIGLGGKYVTFVKKEEYKHARDCMHASFVWLFFTAAFVSVALCTLGGKRFRTIGILVFLFVVVFFLGIILWKIGKVVEMVVVFACGAACHLLVSGISLNLTAGDENCIIYAYMAQAFLMILLAGGILFKNYRSGIAFTRTFLFPLLSTAISGVAVLLISKYFVKTAVNIGGIIITIGIGVVINLVLLVVFRSLRMKDMYMIPGGQIVVFIGKRLHILD